MYSIFSLMGNWVCKIPAVEAAGEGVCKEQGLACPNLGQGKAGQ